MARSQKPQYTCHACGESIIDFDSVASWGTDYFRSTPSLPVYVATCWGCLTGEDP